MLELLVHLLKIRATFWHWPSLLYFIYMSYYDFRKLRVEDRHCFFLLFLLLLSPLHSSLMQYPFSSFLRIIFLYFLFSLLYKTQSLFGGGDYKIFLIISLFTPLYSFFLSLGTACILFLLFLFLKFFSHLLLYPCIKYFCKIPHKSFKSTYPKNIFPKVEKRISSFIQVNPRYKEENIEKSVSKKFSTNKLYDTKGHFIPYVKQVWSSLRKQRFPFLPFYLPSFILLLFQKI